MSLKITKKKAVASMQEGTYLAVCVMVADLGEQYSERFKNYSNKLLIAFEIPSERIEVDGEDKPCWIMKEYTASLTDKANFCKMITSWRGKALSAEEKAEGFDVSELLGKGAMIAVSLTENENGSYNHLESVIGLPKGTKAPKPESDLTLFDWDDFSEEKFNALPEWLQDKIKKSTEYQTKYAIDENIDIPFGDDIGDDTELAF